MEEVLDGESMGLGGGSGVSRRWKASSWLTFCWVHILRWEDWRRSSLERLLGLSWGHGTFEVLFSCLALRKGACHGEVPLVFALKSLSEIPQLVSSSLEYLASCILSRRAGPSYPQP